MPRTRAQTKAQEEAARTKLLDLPPEQLEAIAGCLCPREFVLFSLLARACHEAVTTPAAVQMQEQDRHFCARKHRRKTAYAADTSPTRSAHTGGRSQKRAWLDELTSAR